MWEKVGNDLAGERAKQAATIAEHPKTLLDRVARVDRLVTIIARFFAQAVDLALSHGFLLDREPETRAQKLRACSRHIVALWPGGAHRCLRCYRIVGECAGQQQAQCRTTGRRHLPIFLGGGVFCGRCGSYSFARTVLLAGSCRGEPSSTAVRPRLERMLQGQHLTTGSSFEHPPQQVEEALEMLEVLLG